MQVERAKRATVAPLISRKYERTRAVRSSKISRREGLIADDWGGKKKKKKEKN